MTVPQLATATIGREDELQLLLDATPSAAVISIVGPGGVGKTRLALSAALLLEEQFRAGVCLVWLADVHDPDLLLGEVAVAVGQPRSGGAGLQGLIDWLAARELLLVLDNAEHLITSVCELVAALVARLPGLRVIVTSREPLLLAGETVFALRPLAVPAPGVRSEALDASPAVRLFVERVRSRDRDFEPDADTLEHIVTLCRRLDGLPLALELAAARAAVLGVARVVDRLAGSSVLNLAAGRPSGARHASLRAVFEWSEALLDAPGRALLRRLSVFAGGFTLADMDGVLAAVDDAATDDADTDLDDVLAGLVDKSLVQRDRSTGRYSLLETIRQFAGDRLISADEADDYRDRHARWYLQVATDVGAGVSAGPERPWLERLTPELDNLRIALRRTIDEIDPVSALAVTAGLPVFWWARGQHREGYTWLAETLERAPDAPAELQAAALFGMAFLWAHDTDDWNAAAVHMDRAIELLSADVPILGYLLCLRGEVHAFNGAHAQAIEMTLRGLSILETVPDPWGLAFAVWNVGFALQGAGELDAARTCYQRMADIQAVHGSRLEMMIAWNSLADLAEHAGDFVEAHTFYLRALDMRHDLGATRLGYVHGSLPASLVAVARCELAMGQHERAAAHLDEALPLARDMRDTTTEDTCLQLRRKLTTEAPTAEFTRDGDGWRVHFGDETGHIADSKGMRQLAILLGRPGTPVSAATLTGLADDITVVESDAGPLLDETALRGYRARLATLFAETEAADAAGDAARSDAAERERTAVLAELSRATGLGGRVRRAGSHAERARLNATRTIRDAIARIANQCPQLAEHLTRTIHTGHRCSYDPDHGREMRPTHDKLSATTPTLNPLPK